MTTYYHGTDHELVTAIQVKGLRAGSYVTRHYKDAVKFGYRKAVTNGADTIFIYTVDVGPTTPTVPDPKRDRAFIVRVDCAVVELTRMPTFVAPHKLRRFHLPAKFD